MQALLDRALRLDPSSAGAHHALGILRKLTGRPEMAIESFNRALALNPSFASASAQIGNVLTNLGKPAEGIEEIRKAMRLSPNDPVFHQWLVMYGQAEIELGHETEALESFLKANVRNNRTPRLHALLAAAYALLGDRENAVKRAAELRRTWPDIRPERVSRPGRRTVEGLRMALQWFSMVGGLEPENATVPSVPN